MFHFVLHLAKMTIQQYDYEHHRLPFTSPSTHTIVHYLLSRHLVIRSKSVTCWFLSDTSSEQYVGCYGPLTYIADGGKPKEIEACINTCKIKGKAYAGLQVSIRLPSLSW